MIEHDRAPLLRFGEPVVAALRWTAIGLGVLAVLLSWLGRRYGWLDYRPGGAAFEVRLLPAFTIGFVVALVLALRWQVVGGVLAAFVGAALIAFASNQLVPLHAVAVVAALAIPAVLWIIVDLNELSRRQSAWAIGATVAVAIVGFLAGHVVYDRIWGPTHPESLVDELPPSAVEWLWVGRVTAASAEVRAKPAVEFERVRLLVSTDDDLSEPTSIEAIDTSGPVVGFEIDGLEPATQYFYAVELDGEVDRVRSGRFETFPTGPGSFRIAVGSCARVGSNGRVFDAIRELDPLLYLIAGDFHYGDNDRNDIGRYREVMDLTLTQPAQAALYRSTPVAYVWDDHDYGANDADGRSNSRQAAMAAFREYVPSYDLAGEESALHQAFTVGRVRFVLTDARSARNLDNDDNDDAPSMLGIEQRRWFEEEIVRASRTHELVVWLNPVPWVAEAEDGADHWGGYDVERRALANHIVDNEIDNLLMISGDAHMVAIDDGTNTNYSDVPGPGFPLVHAAALDRPGSIKGGPYSEGAIGSGGQFVTIDFDDDGSSIEVTITGRTWDDQVLLEHRFSTS